MHDDPRKPPSLYCDRCGAEKNLTGSHCSACVLQISMVFFFVPLAIVTWLWSIAWGPVAASMMLLAFLMYTFSGAGE